MSEIKFENYAVKVKGKIDDTVIATLYEVGGVIQAQAQRNSRVDTGQLRSSWSYSVDESGKTVTVGSSLENAIWEEFGTGEYAVNGDGRKGGWRYKDTRGESHFTRGKYPNRTLERAYNEKKGSVRARFESALKGMDK